MSISTSTSFLGTKNISKHKSPNIYIKQLHNTGFFIYLYYYENYDIINDKLNFIINLTNDILNFKLKKEEEKYNKDLCEILYLNLFHIMIEIQKFTNDIFNNIND